MTKPKIDPRPFTLRSDVLNLLAAQAFADLTNEHNARVFLSNLVPSGALDQWHEEHNSKNYVSFDFDPTNEKWRKKLSTTLGIDPTYIRDNKKVSEVRAFKLDSDKDFYRSTVYKLAAKHYLEVSEEVGEFAGNCPSIILRIEE